MRAEFTHYLVPECSVSTFVSPTLHTTISAQVPAGLRPRGFRRCSGRSHSQRRPAARPCDRIQVVLVAEDYAGHAGCLSRIEAAEVGKNGSTKGAGSKASDFACCDGMKSSSFMRLRFLATVAPWQAVPSRIALPAGHDASWDVDSKGPCTLAGDRDSEVSHLKAVVGVNQKTGVGFAMPWMVCRRVCNESSEKPHFCSSRKAYAQGKFIWRGKLRLPRHSPIGEAFGSVGAIREGYADGGSGGQNRSGIERRMTRLG